MAGVQVSCSLGYTVHCGCLGGRLHNTSALDEHIFLADVASINISVLYYAVFGTIRAR